MSGILQRACAEGRRSGRAQSGVLACRQELQRAAADCRLLRRKCRSLLQENQQLRQARHLDAAEEPLVDQVHLLALLARLHPLFFGPCLAGGSLKSACSQQQLVMELACMAELTQGM